MTMVGTSGPYTIFIRQDDDPQSPREWDNFGTMVCFHSRYDLGDKNEYEDHDDFLKDLYISSIGDNEKGGQAYENLLEKFDTPEYPHGSSKYARAVHNEVLETIRKENIIIPLYLLDHSGLSISVRDFNDPWDSGQIGWIYASKEKMLHEFGGAKVTESTLAKALKLLRAETEIYDHYLRGDCIGYELYKNNKEIDSCWGFIGDFKDQLESIKEYLPDDCPDILDNLTEYTPRQSVIDLLKQARMQSQEANMARQVDAKTRHAEASL